MSHVQPPTDRLARRASLLVIGLVSLVVSATALAAAVPQTRQWFVTRPAERPVYAIGSEVSLPVLGSPEARASILVFFRNDCPASQRSLGALKRLATEATAAHLRVALVTGLGDAPGARAFSRAVGVAESALVEIDLTDVAVRAVPSVVVVDAARRVRYFREGEVTADQLGEIQAVAEHAAGTAD